MSPVKILSRKFGENREEKEGREQGKKRGKREGKRGEIVKVDQNFTKVDENLPIFVTGTLFSAKFPENSGKFPQNGSNLAMMTIGK